MDREGEEERGESGGEMEQITRQSGKKQLPIQMVFVLCTKYNEFSVINPSVSARCVRTDTFPNVTAGDSRRCNVNAHLPNHPNHPNHHCGTIEPRIHGYICVCLVRR